MAGSGTTESEPVVAPATEDVTLGLRSKLYLLAMFIDTVGSGLWTPVGLIFFINAQHVQAAQVGVAMTLGGLAGLVVGMLSGNLVDRWGPGRFVFVSNIVRAATFALYPFAFHAWQIALLAAVFSASDRMFWTANTPLLGRFVSGRRLERMLSTQNVVRVVGLGGGAALSGLFIGSAGGLHALAYVNAGSYLIAALIVLALGLAVAMPARSAAPNEATAGWRAVFADGPYVLFCGIQVLFALCARSIVVILPLVALNSLHGPRWLPGVSITVAAGTLAVTQRPLVSLAGRISRLRGLIIAGGTFTAAFALLTAGPHVGRGVAVLVLGAAVIAVVGEALSGPLMTAAANEAAPNDLKGRYSALFQTAWGLATVASPAVFTALLDRGNAALWATLAGISAVTIPALIYVARRFPSSTLRAS